MELIDIIGISVVTGVLSLGLSLICLRCCKSLLDVSNDYKMASEDVKFRRYLGNTIRESLREVRGSFRRIGSKKKEKSKTEKSENEAESGVHGNFLQPSINEFWRERSIIHPSYLSKKSENSERKLPIENPGIVIKCNEVPRDCEKGLEEGAKDKTSKDKYQLEDQDFDFIDHLSCSEILDVDQLSCSSGDTLILDGSMTPQWSNGKISKQLVEDEYEEVGLPRFQNNETMKQSTDQVHVVLGVNLDNVKENEMCDDKERSGLVKNIFRFFSRKKGPDKMEQSGDSKDKNRKLKDRNLSIMARPNSSDKSPDKSLVSGNDNKQKTLSTNKCFSEGTSSVLITCDNDHSKLRKEEDSQNENIQYEIIEQTKNEENYLENVKNDASNVNNGGKLVLSPLKVLSSVGSVSNTSYSSETLRSSLEPRMGQFTKENINKASDLGQPLSSSNTIPQTSSNQGNGTKTRSSLRELKAKRKMNNDKNCNTNSSPIDKSGCKSHKISHLSCVSDGPAVHLIADNNEYEDVAPPGYYDINRPPGGLEVKRNITILEKESNPETHGYADNGSLQSHQRPVKRVNQQVDYRYLTAPLPNASNRNNKESMTPAGYNRPINCSPFSNQQLNKISVDKGDYYSCREEFDHNQHRSVDFKGQSSLYNENTNQRNRMANVMMPEKKHSYSNYQSYLTSSQVRQHLRSPTKTMTQLKVHRDQPHYLEYEQTQRGSQNQMSQLERQGQGKWHTLPCAGQKYAIEGQKYAFEGQTYAIAGQKCAIAGGPKCAIAKQTYAIAGKKGAIPGQNRAVKKSMGPSRDSIKSTATLTYL